MAGERGQRNASAQELRHEPQAARLPRLAGKAGRRGLTGNLSYILPILEEGVAFPARAVELAGELAMSVFLADWAEARPGPVVESGVC